MVDKDSHPHLLALKKCLDGQVNRSHLHPTNKDDPRELRQQYVHLHMQFVLLLLLPIDQQVEVSANMDSPRYRLASLSLRKGLTSHRHSHPKNTHFLWCQLQQCVHLLLQSDRLLCFWAGLFRVDTANRIKLVLNRKDELFEATYLKWISISVFGHLRNNSAAIS